jgi:hypothetical protein
MSDNLFPTAQQAAMDFPQPLAEKIKAHKVSASYVRRLAKIDRICKRIEKKQAEFLARVARQEKS